MIYWADPSGKIWAQNLESTLYTPPSQFQLISIPQDPFRALYSKIQKLQKENQQLKRSLSELHHLNQPYSTRKIRRRAQNQLDKNLACPYPQCKKQYASNLALNLHMKLKHNSGTKKQREALAKKILDARQKGRKEPETSISFPPGFLEEVASTIKARREKSQEE